MHDATIKERRESNENGADEQDGSDDDDSDDDDEVIQRLPVFYTPHFLSSLTLLQYPDRPPRPNTQHPLLPPSLRPDNIDDDDDNAEQLRKRSKIGVRYKPRSQHLELTVPLETTPARWSEMEAAKFAKGLPDPEGEKAEKEKEKKRGRKRKEDPAEVEEERQRLQDERDARRLETMTFASLSVPDVTNYLVGVMKDDALHLTPVTQTYQLRPSLNYLDQIVVNERRAKREAQRKDDDDDSDAEVSDTELKAEAAKAVQVSIKQGTAGGKMASSGGGNGRAGAGLFQPLRMMEAESWVELEHLHAQTHQAEQAFEYMYAQKTQPLSSTTKPKEYLS
ncbi:hypothetical protein T439DRAFT_362041 [Meredithblackwellia eburnea MCA 4105]